MSRTPKRIFAAAVVATFLVSGSSVAFAAPEAKAAPRVALIDFSVSLTEAVGVALASWPVLLINERRVDPSVPVTASAAKAVGKTARADAVLWITETSSGTALWLYDARVGSVTGRRLSSPPPYDEPTAAAVALSVKTLLRNNRVLDSEPKAKAVEIDSPPVTKPPLQPAARPRAELDVGVGATLGNSGPVYYSLSLGGATPISSSLWVGARFEASLPETIESTALTARLFQARAELRVEKRWGLAGQTSIAVACVFGLTLARLTVVSPSEPNLGTTARLNPSLGLALRPHWALNARVFIAPELATWAHASRQLFVRNDMSITQTTRFAARLTLLFGITL